MKSSVQSSLWCKILIYLTYKLLVISVKVFNVSVYMEE